MRPLLLAAAVLLALPAAGQTVKVLGIKTAPAPDTTAPSTISDLSVGTPTTSTCPIAWTAPYDDNPNGGTGVGTGTCETCDDGNTGTKQK